MTLSQARDARWFGPLAVALVIGTPLLFLSVMVANLLRWSDAAAGVDAAADHLARVEARIRAEAGRPVPPRGDLSTVYLTAGTNSLAHAELQQRLVIHVERAGGRLIEVRGDEAPDATSPRSILLRLSLDIGNEGLFDLLLAIEAGLPLLTVDAVNIRPVSGRNANSEEANPSLRVALAVRGHRKEDTQ